MQTQHVAAWRTTVTVGFLIALPLAAILGSGFPGLVVDWFSGKPAYSAKQSPARSLIGAGDMRPMPRGPSVQSSVSQEADVAPPAASNRRKSSSIEELAHRDRIAAQRGTVEGNGLWETTAGSAIPTNFEVPLEAEETLTPRKGGPDAAALPRQPAVARRLENQLEDQLRELAAWGARDVRLESWGSAGELFRFQCGLTVGTARLKQHFEATSPDPARAVDLVYRQVAEVRSR